MPLNKGDPIWGVTGSLRIYARGLFELLAA